MKKLAAGISYQGNNYCGWQSQKNIISIQEYVELALFKFSGEKIKIYCAGRTDAKVHALLQVVHFYTDIKRSYRQWILGVNSYLPYDISIMWVIKVHNNFHARYSAIAKKYLYLIHNNISRSGIFRKYCFNVFISLNINDMKKAAQKLIGKHDFSSFKGSECQSKTTYRVIYYIRINKYKEYIFVEIKANSFLNHMMRNIIGNLIEIGKGKKSKEWMSELLFLKNNKFSIFSADPKGLYLSNVYYPFYFNIPKFNFKLKNFLKIF
ncbi:truA [Wigglesworthia glossinidia endosymbiont of Glossina brevipalpis]|uniref:tRNA pseudouridine synthase A n=1 Tax=Wigglesworthia glossinidia brevipalpis TaxID=36870 RepID=TRUA_WIGBR|nr:RecName: Full=tRNA pseudouridine synthase A; AltName: Full=tRNA pseudouridine(38-40) synthase; AltName: Full=tRNA pseudouridylate synthase I; AltName: Full=tRNA-uridine isomerase I [Wigglesworthia glossinidia endosymbiont of Glossina brevipalpis]BAC24455.1 truA [Wigglesworthia glossinidia endosymbiont of Glossina brevipalpis]